MNKVIYIFVGLVLGLIAWFVSEPWSYGPLLASIIWICTSLLAKRLGEKTDQSTGKKKKV